MSFYSPHYIKARKYQLQASYNVKKGSTNMCLQCRYTQNIFKLFTATYKCKVMITLSTCGLEISCADHMFQPVRLLCKSACA